MGITRVADITGLDHVGVPVTLVVRPASRSLAVSQGKGLTLASARVSGIMESVETFHAERVSSSLKLSTRAVLAKRERVVDVARMAKSREREFDDDSRLLWIEGVDLLSKECRWLPYEAVHTDYTLPRPSGSGFFPANTNGLGSGNTLSEATLHALCEVIERDALTLLHQRRERATCLVDTAGIDDTDCADVLEALEVADIDVAIWNATSDSGVPCFECLIIGRGAHDTDPEFGSGCHPNRHVALLRALTEAIQGRTTFISGSRDDYGAAPYTDAARAVRHDVCRRLMNERGGSPVSFTSIENTVRDETADDLEHVLARLASIGIDEVMRVDLTLPEFAIPVVRVVVPGLEGAFKGADDDYVMGERARRVREA